MSFPHPLRVNVFVGVSHKRRTDVSFCLLAPSYIHVTCQYVIQDKVLQPGILFTKMSSCCSLCVSGRETYTGIPSAHFYEEKDWAHLVSFTCPTKIFDCIFLFGSHLSYLSFVWFITDYYIGRQFNLLIAVPNDKYGNYIKYFIWHFQYIKNYYNYIIKKYIMINQSEFPSLVLYECITLPICAMSITSTLSLETVFSFTVLFSSPLCIIPSPPSNHFIL